MLATLSLGGLAVAAREGLRPVAPHEGVAVVFSPWTAKETAFVRAVESGARFVRFGGLPFVAVVVPDDDDYSERVAMAGAWLVADPKLLAACLPKSIAERRG